MDEAPCTCIGTMTIVGQEKTPQVVSLFAVGLGPIFDGHTPNARISITNFRINVRVTMT